MAVFFIELESMVDIYAGFSYNKNAKGTFRYARKSEHEHGILY